MPLRFPDLETLTLALTSGLVPAETAAAAVEAAFEADGGVWVRPVRSPGKAITTALKKLGIEEGRASKAAWQPFTGWPQLLPLERDPATLRLGDKSAVVFDLSEGEALPELAGEMLRLGNDRQSFRQLAAGRASRTLLRVIGPPYYSLLRVIEQPRGSIRNPALSPGGSGSDETASRRQQTDIAPTAYYEQAPRVWVQLGYRHPLAPQLQPAPGQWLLLRPERVWEAIPEAPFQDLFTLLDLRLPQAASEWRDAEPQQRLTVNVRLRRASGNEPAELWVMDSSAANPGGFDAIDRLVRDSDDHLLARLAFAVGQADGRTVVVLRARPSKLPPPVLVLPALACRAYLKLPNLFVPVELRLHPPLRRDAVAKLLTPDPAQLVWLEPQEGGTFTPHSLPDAAFRPLADWVDYVLDREHELLSAWIGSHRFDFASFVCADEARPKPPAKTRPALPAQTASVETPSFPVAAESAAPAEEQPTEALEMEAAERLEEGSSSDAPELSPSLQRLRQLEHEFRQLEEPPDGPGRRPLWRQMGSLNLALRRPHDAALCFATAVWEEPAPPREILTEWAKRERGDRPALLPAVAELERLVQDGVHETSAARWLAVSLIAQTALRPGNSGAIDSQQLGLLSRALEAQEARLPTRLAWLAWVALSQLSGGDGLALARARDRLLERLYHQGLTADNDLPSFLRASEEGDEQPAAVPTARLLQFRKLVQEWIVDLLAGTARTGAYADLLLAYGLARRGEASAARGVMAEAQERLAGSDPVHRWAAAAFTQRIAEATQGRPHVHFDAELLHQLEKMDRHDRYKIDRLRQHSRVLEPFERIDPYRRWHGRYADELSRELALLFDLADRRELRRRIEKIFQAMPTGADGATSRLRALPAALELAPRLGEDFAAGLLDHALPLLDRAPDMIARTLLLDKALAIAGHYDRSATVAALVERFQQQLPEIVALYLTLQAQYDPQTHEKLTAIESLFGRSLRGLRRLGLRDEIEAIYARLVELLHGAPAAKGASRGGKKSKGSPGSERMESLRAAHLLLHVAGGWFHLGQHEQALRITGEVRRCLFEDELAPQDRKNLACTYVAAVGAAEPATAWPLVAELFQRKEPGSPERNLPGISDTFVTATHFSLSQLNVVEAAVLALTDADSALSPSAQRWLEEDEYYVRHRVHRDVRGCL